MNSWLAQTDSPAVRVPARDTSLVWVASIDAVAEEDCLPWLHPEDLPRLERLKHPAVRRTFLASRALLRRLLALTTETPPGEQHFTFNAQGKPCLRDRDDWHFNLSHSMPWVMVALSRNPIGVDVERMRARPSLLQLARRYFSPEERELVFSAPDPAAMFYRIWTYKEAWLKAEGLGITVELSEWDTSRFWNNGEPHPEGWTFHPADPEPRVSEPVMAGIVSRDRERRVEWLR